MNLKSLLTSGGKTGETLPAETPPFGSLQKEIDRVFADFTRGWPSFSAPVALPRMDVTERPDGIELTAELPGLEEKDVELTLTDNILTVKGEKKEERSEGEGEKKLVERSYGAFSRSIELPPGIKAEDIKANLAKGVLTVTLPKPAAAPAAPQKIEVKPS